MKYSDWNNLLYHYYFDDVDDNVFLFVDKDTLMQYALESNAFAIDESDGKTYSDEEKVEYIWKDFCSIFTNIEEGHTPSLEFFADLFAQKIADIENDIPQVFPFIAVCLMSFEESQGLNANNFYDRVNKFLSENKIIQPNINKGKFVREFTSINGIIKMWELLDKWAKDKELPYSSKFTQRDRNDYVLPFLYECLITPTKRQLFAVLFKNLGLAPKVDYQFDDRQIIGFISQRYSDLGLNSQQWEKYRKEYSGIIIDEFRRAYSKWNGDTWIIRRTGTRKEKREFGSVHSMILTMHNYLGQYSFYLKLYAPQIERGEYVSLKYHNTSFQTHIGLDGFGKNPIMKDYDILFEALRNNNKISYTENIETAQNTQNKAIFVPVDFFLFQQKGMEFSSACSLIKGGHYFFLKKDSVTIYDFWLKENNSVLIRQNIKNSGYSLYNIPQVLKPLPSIPRLSYDDKKTATLSNTLKLRFEKENNTYYLYNGFPAFFVIKGVDVTTEVTATTYDENGVAKNVYKLKYNPENDLWEMPVISNFFDKKRAFKLFNNGQSLSNFRFAFCGLNDITGTNFVELKYNKWGQYDQNGEFEGLKIPNVVGSGIPDAMKANMESKGMAPRENLDIYEPTDYILYFLSSHPDIMATRDEIKDIIKVLTQNKILDDTTDDNDRRILNNYCRLGYINCFYDKNCQDSGSAYKIAVNRPTLIMLPPKYERIESSGIENRFHYSQFQRKQISFSCTESWYKFLLSGARTPEYVKKLINTSKNMKDIRVQVNKSESPLYPHEIIIWANTESAVRELAASLNIDLQFCIYSVNLFDRLGDIDSFRDSLLSKESQYSYENISSYEVVDFQRLNEINEENVFTIPQKRLINKDSEVVCYWPRSGYTEEHILWNQGRVFHLDKFWANYIGAYIYNKQIIKVEDYRIITPYIFRFPVIFDRALTLISGKLPKIITINNRRQYLVYSLYDSPFIHINSSSIVNKLKQDNHG